MMNDRLTERETDEFAGGVDGAEDTFKVKRFPSFNAFWAASSLRGREAGAGLGPASTSGLQEPLAVNTGPERSPGTPGAG